MLAKIFAIILLYLSAKNYGIFCEIFNNSTSTYTTNSREENIEDEYTFIISSPDSDDKMILLHPSSGCSILPSYLKRKYAEKSLHNYEVGPEYFYDIIILCENYKNETISASDFLSGIENYGIFIYPGTKWCGTGNSAENVADLGYNTETDKCCREHDTCENFIKGFSCREEIGLCNRTPITRSHCYCDENFRSCLRKSREKSSDRIGILFFTVFGIKCFQKDYPIIKCEERGGFLNIHCQKYRQDKGKGKIYQFFDTPKYNYTRVNK